MKKIIFIVFCVFIKANFIFSQIEFKINEIRISRIITITDTIYVEGISLYPKIEVSCEINNKTELPIILNFRECKVIVLYNYQNKKYECEIGSIMDDYSWSDNKWGRENNSIMILPNNNYELFFTTSYLEGADFVQTKRLPIIDCTREVIETLPTLKVIYKDNNIDITTNETKNVMIDNFIFNLDEYFGHKK